MILRRLARPSAFGKSVSKLARPSSCPHQRSVHTLPPLGNSANDRGNYFAEHGVPGFLSSKTYKQTWVQYQQHLLNEINSRTADSEWGARSLYDMHVNFSRRPDLADQYNLAAMAMFNHFWWEGISDAKTEVPTDLLKDINEVFSSMSNLRTEMLQCAEAIFGNGFVWLMKEKPRNSAIYSQHSNLRILCTYNAGSPYPDAWRMRQSRDSATAGHWRFADQSMTIPQNRVGAGQYLQDKDAAPNALLAEPLLCLNVWQHMWVPDYGILNKRTYLAAWWERIDWEVVNRRYNKSSLV